MQLTTSLAALEARFKRRMQPADAVELPIHFANAFSQPTWPVISTDAPGIIVPMRWGFVPAWAKEGPKDFLRTRMTYNCVSEEVADKPVFRNAFKQGRRCLVPVTGFYEHHHAGKGAKALKVPYLIQVRSEPLFCLGGLFERDTFTLFTTAPNAAMARIHNSKQRQVLIIPKALEAAWLDPALSLEEVTRFFTPYPEEDMKWHTIGKRITQRGFDPNIPEINDPVEYPELSGLIP